MFKKALILGRGYTGRFLEKALASLGAEVECTTRTGPGLRFDLGECKTWAALPSAEVCFWLFPAEPLERVKEFWLARGARFRTLVVVSSTGFLIPDGEHAEVSEDSPVELQKERVQGEEYLRENGGIVVHASGIYGPGRDPRDWVKAGRVGKSNKYVNFIHVEDLCEFLIRAADRGTPAARYIASDNQPLRWQEIIEGWEKEYGIVASDNLSPSERISKRVDSTRSLESLQVRLKFASVVEGVRSIEVTS